MQSISENILYVLLAVLILGLGGTLGWIVWQDDAVAIAVAMTEPSATAERSFATAINSLTPEATQTPLPTATPTTAPTASPITTPTSVPTMTPTLTFTPTPPVTYAEVYSSEADGIYLREAPYGRIRDTLPNGTAVRVLDDEPVEEAGLFWVHVLVKYDHAFADGWVAKQLLTEASPESIASIPDENLACRLLPVILHNALPMQEISFTGGETPVVSLWGMTTGEIRQEKRDGAVIDLTRLFYLAEDGEPRDLWTATGYLSKKDEYFPMNIASPQGQRDWGTAQEAAQIFGQSGQVVRLSLTGFVRAGRELAWEDCADWAAFNPAGICSLGTALELETRGGSAAFIQSGKAPDDWFAFGWDVQLMDEYGQADLPAEILDCP